MKLVVIIPALNEEATIGQVIQGIPRQQLEGIREVEVVVVDDGSTDGTAEVARQAGAFVVRHPFNRGVGAAFSTGIRTALQRGADLIVNIDGDGQFNPADIPALLEPILCGRADMTTCTRFGRKELEPDMPWIKKWGNRVMCRIINTICWGANFTDVSCGFRAYTREAALRLNLFGSFTYTQETFIDLVSKGMTIVEVPLKVRGVREHGESRVASNLWRYALQSGSIILRAARDVRPLAFFGLIGTGLAILGAICGLIVFGVWLKTGATSPVKSLLIGSGTFLMLGFLLMVFALLADMLGRQRRVLEEILFMLKQDRLKS